MRTKTRAGTRAGLGFRVLLVCVAWLSTANASAQDAAAKPRSAPDTWHCTAYVRGDMGIRVIDYWSRGDQMVARTLISGHPITTLVSGGRYVVYDEISGEGVDIARAPAALALDKKRERPFAFELDDLKAAGGEKVEDVTIGAMRGEIWQVRDRAGRRKLWVSSGVPTVPLRMETFDRATGQTIELDYQGWVFDMPLTDRFFVPPSDLALMRFEQKAWLERGPGLAVPNVPILYPDLLFGEAPR